MEPKNKPSENKVAITPIDSGNLQQPRRDGTKRTSIDRLSDVVDRLYGPDYRAARRLIHKRLRQKEMGSRGRKPPSPPDETLYQRIMAFRNGKGTPGTSPHPSAGSETPPSSSKQSNRATQRQSPEARTPQRSPPNRAQHRTPPQSSRNPQRNTPQNRTPQKTPPAKRPVSRPRSRNAKKYELSNTPSPSKSKKEAKSPYDRGSSKSSFDSVELPPLEDDDDDHNQTPKPTQQDRIQSTRADHRHYRKKPDTAKPDEPSTARDVYVEMGDEARDSSSRMSRKSSRQEDLPPVREATPKRADRPLSRAHSDLNRHHVVPPIKSNEEQRQSRNSTPEQRESSRPSSHVSSRQERGNTSPDQRRTESRRSDEDRLTSAQSNRDSERGTSAGKDDDRRSDDREPSRASSSHSNKSKEKDNDEDRTSRQPSRVQSSKSNPPESKPTKGESRHNTPTSDDARATVLSPRDVADSPTGPPPAQVPQRLSSSPQGGPIRQDEPDDANKGNPNDANDANEDSPNNEDDPDSPSDSPEPEIPRRTPKVREEDGRIAALDKLADYNLKTLAGQDAGDAPEIDDTIMKEVFSPEFQKELDNFLKT